MTVRDFGVESTFDDPDEGWFGAAHDLVEPEPVEPEPVQPEPEADADTDRWYVPDTSPADPADPADVADPLQREAHAAARPPVTESIAASLNVVPTRRNGFVRAAAPASWESRLSTSGAWEFKATSDGGWRRSKPAMATLAILAGLAVAVGIVLLLRSPGALESTSVVPSESDAPPAPSTSAPALTSALPLAPPPPVLPPPPPPAAEEISPPAVTRQYVPRYQTPDDEPKKPQTNVTRAPMSATPPAPPSDTNQGHSTPGDSGRRRHGFFG